MSLIKSLIQRLLDSRTTPAQAGHNAMPSSTPTTISTPASITSWGTITTFTAPDDGYVTFRGRSMAAAAAAQIASLPLENNPTVITATQDNYQGMSCNLPVVKGKTVEVYGSNVENIVVSFNRLIGGGYNLLIRRALSCLRALSNFSPKNSLLAEATGFLTNPIQLFKRRISHLQRQENGFLSSLLATGGSASKGLPRKFCLATGRFGRGAIQQRHLIKAFVSLSQKAGLWPTYYRQTPRAHTSSLLRVLVINNLQTGGALC